MKPQITQLLVLALAIGCSTAMLFYARRHPEKLRGTKLADLYIVYGFLIAGAVVLFVYDLVHLK